MAEKKAVLYQQARDACQGAATASIVKLAEGLITACHKKLETAQGTEVNEAQGEIKAYRNLQGILTKQKKTS